MLYFGYLVTLCLDHSSETGLSIRIISSVKNAFLPNAFCKILFLVSYIIFIAHFSPKSVCMGDTAK